MSKVNIEFGKILYHGRDGTIGSLGNDLRLDLVRVGSVDGFLNCARHQDVALLEQQRLAVVRFCARESDDRSVLL